MTGGIPAQRRASMYADNFCTHHGQQTRLVGRPGSREERQQCDRCEMEFQRALGTLAAA